VGVVAVTRELGSLGTYIAERLAERRGYRFVRREVLEEAAKVGELSEEHLAEAIEGRPGLWERLSLPARRSYLHVAASVLEFAAADNVVILGRWSTMLLRGVRHAVRVRVCAPPELRTARLMRRMSIPHAEAQALSQRYDEGVRARLRQFFDVEWEDSDLYDLVINTERLSIDQGCELVERLLDSPEFGADDASRQEVRDRALAARVAEAMKLDDRTAHVDLRITARRGTVVLHGLVFSPEDRDAAVGVASHTPGVTEVTASVTVGRMPFR
jgi:cytidylate kinase